MLLRRWRRPDAYNHMLTDRYQHGHVTKLVIIMFTGFPWIYTGTCCVIQQYITQKWTSIIRQGTSKSQCNSQQGLLPRYHSLNYNQWSLEYQMHEMWFVCTHSKAHSNKSTCLQNSLCPKPCTVGSWRHAIQGNKENTRATVLRS